MQISSYGYFKIANNLNRQSDAGLNELKKFPTNVCQKQIRESELEIPFNNVHEYPSSSQGTRYEAYACVLPSREGMTASGSEIKLTGDRGLLGGMSSFDDQMAKIRQEFAEKLKFVNSSVRNGTMSSDERKETLKDLYYKQKPQLENIAKSQETGLSRKRTGSSDEDRPGKR